MRSTRPMSEPNRIRNRARLSFEVLDSRLAPSDLLGPLTNDSNPDESGEWRMILRDSRGENVAPRVTNFTVAATGGGLWRLSGDVIDEAPADLTIAFGGEPATLQHLTVTTDANGHFDRTVLLRTDGSDAGMASAQTTDAGGMASNVATYMIVM